MARVPAQPAGCAGASAGAAPTSRKAIFSVRSVSLPPGMHRLSLSTVLAAIASA